MALDLDAIRARVAAATPALLRYELVRSADYYELDGHELSMPWPNNTAVAIVFGHGDEPDTGRADAELFAHAYTDLIALLDALTQATDELHRLRAEIGPLRGLHVLAGELCDARGGAAIEAAIRRIGEHLGTCGGGA